MCKQNIKKNTDPNINQIKVTHCVGVTQYIHVNNYNLNLNPISTCLSIGLSRCIGCLLLVIIIIIFFLIKISNSFTLHNNKCKSFYGAFQNYITFFIY